MYNATARWPDLSYILIAGFTSFLQIVISRRVQGNEVQLKGRSKYDHAPIKLHHDPSYLHAVEARCHAVEALIGILMALPDQRAVSLLTELAEDPFARSVLDQVNNSAFGLRGRPPKQSTFSAAASESSNMFAGSTSKRESEYTFVTWKEAQAYEFVIISTRSFR